MDRDEQDDRTTGTGVPGAEEAPAPSVGQTSTAPGDAAHDAEQAEQTGWSMIGRSWSAADPTHTGEFPVVGRSSGGPSLPDFDDIVNPSSPAGLVPPPQPPSSGTDAASPQSGRVPFPVLHSDGTPPPVQAEAMSPASLWDTTPESWDGSPDEGAEADPSSATEDEAPASRDGSLGGGEQDAPVSTGRTVSSAFPAFEEVARESGSTPPPSWSEIVADARAAEDVPAGDDHSGDGAFRPSLLHSSDAVATPGSDTSGADAAAGDASASEARSGTVAGVASGALAAAGGLGATLGAWGRRLVSPLRPKDTEQESSGPDVSAQEVSEPEPLEPSSTNHPVPPAPEASTTILAATGDADDGSVPPTPPPASPAATPPGMGNGRGDGRGSRIDPTRPSLVFGLLLVVVGLVWSVSVLRSPVTDINLAQSLASAESTAESSAQSSSPEPSASASTAQAAPSIQSVTVYSWKDDGGDNEDTAINMIDGDPTTEWHSRWYDYNQFLDSQTVTILLKLKETTTVSGLTLQMDSTTSGGDMLVRSVDPDTTNPREGTEVTSTALSPTTTITFPEPIETGALSLSFTTMPTSVDGNPWAWIYEITVQ